MALEIFEEIRTPWTILHLNGKLDAVTSIQLDEALFKCVHDGKSHIAIDCAQLQYISSSGIRVFLSYHKKLLEKQRQFVLVGLAGHLLEIIKLAGFDRVFVMTASVNQLSSS